MTVQRTFDVARREQVDDLNRVEMTIILAQLFARYILVGLLRAARVPQGLWQGAQVESAEYGFLLLALRLLRQRLMYGTQPVQRAGGENLARNFDTCFAAQA